MSNFQKWDRSQKWMEKILLHCIALDYLSMVYTSTDKNVKPPYLQDSVDQVKDESKKLGQTSEFFMARILISA